jgi:hypothetical protein
MHGKSFCVEGNKGDRENRAGGILMSLLSPLAYVPSSSQPLSEIEIGKLFLSNSHARSSGWSQRGLANSDSQPRDLLTRIDHLAVFAVANADMNILRLMENRCLPRMELPITP